MEDSPRDYTILNELALRLGFKLSDREGFYTFLNDVKLDLRDADENENNFLKSVIYKFSDLLNEISENNKLILSSHTFMTNFEAEDLEIYIKTIKNHNLDLMISPFAYDYNRCLITNYFSLHKTEKTPDLSKFWKEFHNVKLKNLQRETWRRINEKKN